MTKLLLFLLFIPNMAAAAYYDEFYPYLKDLCATHNAVEETCQEFYGYRCHQGIRDAIIQEVTDICRYLEPFELAIEDLNKAEQALRRSKEDLRESKIKLLKSKEALKQRKAALLEAKNQISKEEYGKMLNDYYVARDVDHFRLQQRHYALQENHQALQDRHHVMRDKAAIINSDVYDKRLYICGAALGPAAFCAD